jgi:crotonobetainyl-CoA:carnitine CoA-transferase CaiB-like acyl-CoA transferase
MDRWGLGYESLKALRPDIIYAQQSGMGQRGTYGRFKAVGPIAAAFTGLCDISGLPEPALPAGWGYSYLDWAGAYSRIWPRTGNRSPYQAIAPHGAFQCRGTDRWVAISCTTETQWDALAAASGHQDWHLAGSGTASQDERNAPLHRRPAGSRGAWIRRGQRGRLR